MSTWWAQGHEPALSDDGIVLPPHLVSLLDAVEARFAVTGRDTPAWPDPHTDPDASFGVRDPEPEEYSRLSEPGKYAILEDRAQAWLDVLTSARLAADVERHRDGDTMTWTVTPCLPAALALTLTVRRDPQDGWTGVDVAVGAPPLDVLSLPQCGCDACDDGSAPLLEALDQMLLSVVDGSLTAQAEQEFVLSTPFVSERSSSCDPAGPRRSVEGASWFAGQGSMPKIPPP